MEGQLWWASLSINQFSERIAPFLFCCSLWFDIRNAGMPSRLHCGWCLVRSSLTVSWCWGQPSACPDYTISYSLVFKVCQSLLHPSNFVFASEVTYSLLHHVWYNDAGVSHCLEDQLCFWETTHPIYSRYQCISSTHASSFATICFACEISTIQLWTPLAMVILLLSPWLHWSW